MRKEKIFSRSTEKNVGSLPAQRKKCSVLVKKFGKTTYRVTIHFSATTPETMSDKIKRMLKNEVQRT